MNAPFALNTDPDDLLEQLREELSDEFTDWVREGIRGTSEKDWNPREDVSLDDWLAQMSQPHMRDWERYAAARLSDKALVALSMGQRRWNRENRNG